MLTGKDALHEAAIKRVLEVAYLPICRFHSEAGAAREVELAESGSPLALAAILTRLVSYLRKTGTIPEEFATFCSGACIRFARSQMFPSAKKEYDRIVASAGNRAEIRAGQKDRECLTEAKFILEVGPRLSERWIYRLGSSFTTAFRLQLGNWEKSESTPNPELRKATIFEIEQAVHRRDPEGLQVLFEILGNYMAEREPLPVRFGDFCASAFQVLLDSDEMELAKLTFSKTRARLAHDSCSDGDEGDLRRLQRAFCRAFQISGKQGKELPFNLVASRLEFILPLIQIGVTERRAIQIVQSGDPGCLSSRRIANQLQYLRREVRKREESKEAKDKIEKAVAYRSKDLIALVWKALCREGLTFGDALKIAGEVFVKEYLQLPEATIFVDPAEVKRVWKRSLSAFKMSGSEVRAIYWPGESEHANQIQYEVAVRLLERVTLIRAQSIVNREFARRVLGSEEAEVYLSSHTVQDVHEWALNYR